MSGRVGTASIYHARLPHQWKLERMSADILSKEARRRLAWMDYYRKRGNARLTCRHFGISPTTFHKWYGRFKREGLQGLEDRSKAPIKRRTSKVTREQASLVVSIRKEHPCWSKHKIAVILARDHAVRLSASTVGRILKRKGLYDANNSQKRRRAARKRAKKLRAEAWMRDLYPGALVQVDTKHLRFNGQKYYQFTATDCFTRMSFIHVRKSISSRAGSEFFSRLVEFMPFEVQAIQTDNGSEYEKEFERALEGAGIDHYFTYPRCPAQNGRVERKIGTTQSELWDWRVGYSVEELNEIADEWNHTYNEVRPHQALGYKTPGEFLKSWNELSKDRVKASTM